MNNFGLIAEVKLKSPYGFKSQATFQELFSLARTYGNWISIHTDSRWGGSFDLINHAASEARQPILAKGIHSRDQDIEKALKLGAKAVLVVGRIPAKELLPYVWLEPQSFDSNNLKQLEEYDCPIVLNQRNLDTGKRRPFPVLMSKGTYIAASYLKTPFDIPKWASGWIVGESLPKFTNLLAC